MLSGITEFIVWVPVIIIALTFHEYAHGLAAYVLGDTTARDLGRLTVNPLPHIDWIGFLIMLFPPHFGWARPVPVNPYGLRRLPPRSGMMLVALAGPAMNLLLAVVSLLVIKALSPLAVGSYNTQLIIELLYMLFQVNVVLAVFNLIPIPPLDGSKILAGLLPASADGIMFFLERYGFLILLVLILSSGFSRIVSPVILKIEKLLLSIIM